LFIIFIVIINEDEYKIIQFEAFHVFKVFVANPKKPQQIIDILAKNKSKLITFLTNFHSDRSFFLLINFILIIFKC
jgi:calcium binding protein 39